MDRKCNSKTLCGSLAVIFCTFKQIGHHMTLSVMSRRGVDPVATVRGGGQFQSFDGKQTRRP